MALDAVSSFVVESRSARMTREVAGALFRALTPPRIILLSGDLGAGKTTFAKGFVGASGVDERDVKSPTFAIARTHGSAPPIHHLDLYRFDDEAALFALGLEDLLHDPHALVVVEWPSRMPSLESDPSVVAVELTLRSARVRGVVVRFPLDLAPARAAFAHALASLDEGGGRRRAARLAREAGPRRKTSTDVDR